MLATVATADSAKGTEKKYSVFIYSKDGTTRYVRYI